jgi:hypothetical protein
MLELDSRFKVKTESLDGDTKSFRGVTVTEQFSRQPIESIPHSIISAQRVLEGPIRSGNVIVLYYDDRESVLFESPFRVISISKLDRRQFIVRITPISDSDIPDLLCNITYTYPNWSDISVTVITTRQLSRIAVGKELSVRFISDHSVYTVFGKGNLTAPVLL